MHKLIFRITLFLSVFVYRTVCAQQTPPSITELIDSAINKDYTLANQKIDIELSVLDRQKLANSFLPRVNIDGALAFSLTSISLTTKELKIPQLNIDIDEGRNRFTLISNIAALNTNASMLLYSGGKIPLLKKSIDEKVKGQRHLTEKEIQDVISEVISTYDMLALLKQVRIVLDESEKRLAENMKTADKAFSYGLITKYEHQKIEVAQAQVASKIKDYEGKRSVVQEKLYWLTNIPVERIALIDNSQQKIENVFTNNDVANHPGLKALDAFIFAQNYKIKAERTWFIPKIYTAASVKYMGIFWGHTNSSKPVLNGQKLSSQMPGLYISPMFQAGVGFKWDLFDGKEGKHEVAKATLELRQTENNKKELMEKLSLNLTKCRSDYTVSLSQVTIMVKQKETASNALTQATKEYKTGLIKTSQLIDAEEDFEIASLGLIQSLYNQRRAAIELLKATGSLKPESFR